MPDVTFTDPNLIARLLMEGRAPLSPFGLPQLPPLQRQQPEFRAGGRPLPATAPVEQALTDQMVSGPAMAYQGGQMIGEGIQGGRPGDIAGGTGLTGLAMIAGPGRSRSRLPKPERFSDADTSHIGTAFWAGLPLGAGAGYLAGHQFDPTSEMGPAGLAGGGIGMGLGGALGIKAIMSHMRQMDEAAKRDNVISRNFGLGVPAEQAATEAAARNPSPRQAPTRGSLVERMQQAREVVPEPSEPQARPGASGQTYHMPDGKFAPKRLWPGDRGSYMPFGFGLPSPPDLG
jgi:hypothetical protein